MNQKEIKNAGIKVAYSSKYVLITKSYTEMLDMYKLLKSQGYKVERGLGLSLTVFLED